MLLRTKIILATLGWFGLVLLLGVVMLYTTRNLERAEERIRRNIPAIKAAEEIEVAGLRMHNEWLLYSQNHDPTHREAHEETEREAFHWLEVARRNVEDPEELRLLDVIEVNLGTYLRRVSDLSGENHEAEINTSFQGFYQAAEALIDHHQAQITTLSSEDITNETRINYFIAVVLISSLGLGVALVFALRRQLVNPLARLLAAIRRLRDGELGARVEIPGKDEFALLGGALDEMAARLERTNQDKLAFVAQVAHELRTPLTTIRAYAQILAGGKLKSDGAKQREIFEVIARQSERLSRLITDLLDVARLEAGHISLKQEPVRLDERARAVALMFQASAPDHRIILEANAAVVVKGDGDRLEQVIVNLLSNAVKYSPAGGEIRVRVMEEKQGAVLSVEDQGVGMTPGERERLFVRFTRLDATKEIVPGVGLGLALSREIVRAHGGDINVESQPGSGSVFSVHLPHLGTELN